MPMVWKKTGLVFGARWRRSSSSPKQAGIRLETKPTDADRRRVWDAAQKKLKSLDDLGVEDLSNFIAILLLTTMMFNNVFNAVKSIIKLVLTTKSRLPSPSAAITLEFFWNHVMVLFVAANGDAGDRAEHSRRQKNVIYTRRFQVVCWARNHRLSAIFAAAKAVSPLSTLMTKFMIEGEVQMLSSPGGHVA